jgi:hypothetical protein
MAIKPDWRAGCSMGGGTLSLENVAKKMKYIDKQTANACCRR